MVKNFSHHFLAGSSVRFAYVFSSWLHQMMKMFYFKEICFLNAPNTTASGTRPQKYFAVLCFKRVWDRYASSWIVELWSVNIYGFIRAFKSLKTSFRLRQRLNGTYSICCQYDTLWQPSSHQSIRFGDNKFRNCGHVSCIPERVRWKDKKRIADLPKNYSAATTVTRTRRQQSFSHNPSHMLGIMPQNKEVPRCLLLRRPLRVVRH